MSENSGFMEQIRYFSFTKAILNISQEVYSGSFKMLEDYRVVDFWIQGQKTIKSSLMGLVLMTSGAKTRKSWHNITSKNILVSDHCSLGHVFVGPPPTTHRASGGPTNKMCLRKSVCIIICPPPLAHHTLYCYLQSRHSTKCNALML